MSGESAALPLEIDVRTVAARLKAAGAQPGAGDLALVDCREPDEHQLVHIEGAELIPMSQFAGRVDELAKYRDRPLVVHCHHGGRSLRVVKWLRENGYPMAQSMAGGIDAWSLEIDPTKPRY